MKSWARVHEDEILSACPEKHILKILVLVKRVMDHNLKPRLRSDARGVELAGQKMVMNPFDEVALEEAIRLKEKGLAREVIVLSCGAAACQDVLRHGLALGADRAVLLETDAELQSLALARLVRQWVERDKPDLVLCGKQAIDDDAAQLGPQLAAMLGWPQATFAVRIEFDDGKLRVSRALDGCEETWEMALPALVSVELHLNQPRYASLVNVMKARRALIETMPAASFAGDLAPRLESLGLSEPPPRRAGRRLESPGELIDCLREEGFLKGGDA